MYTPIEKVNWAAGIVAITGPSESEFSIPPLCMYTIEEVQELAL